MAKRYIFLIGIDEDGKPTDLLTTKDEIRKIEKFEVNLHTRQGDIITWKHINDYKNSSTIFQTILKDREMRIDKGFPMKDKPRYAVITFENRKVIRFEYYEGKEKLRLKYDIRRLDLYNEFMKNYKLEL